MEIRITGLTGTTIRRANGSGPWTDVDLTIPTNQIFTLLGPSGCGKTTLLRCIVGLETPDAGEIAIGGEMVWSKEKKIFVPPEKRGLGMVFQTYAIWPHMNVFDNVAYPLQNRQDAQGGDPQAGGAGPRIRAAGGVRETPGDQAVRRPAAAGRPGPGAGGRAQGDPVRRAVEQPGRQAARGNPQGAAALSHRPEDHRGLRHPRPDRGPGALRPHRGDARGPDRRDRRAARKSISTPTIASSPTSSAGPT